MLICLKKASQQVLMNKLLLCLTGNTYDKLSHIDYPLKFLTEQNKLYFVKIG